MIRRIVIKGSSGAGKSTLAAELARRLGLLHVELDALYHGPNWSQATPEQLRARLEPLLNDERGWAVDGNFDSHLGEFVRERAELIVWLDLPLGTKMIRLTSRSMRRWITREELWHGNRESLRALFVGSKALFPWALRSHFRHRRQWPTSLAGRPLVRLRSDEEVREWLAAMASAEPSGRHEANG